jgi:predicted nucleic acid-binding protein
MNLTDIRKGSRVLLDSNILLYAAARHSRECVALIERIANGVVEACLTTVTVAEVCHRWMMEECRAQGIVLGGNPARALSEKRQVITQLTNYYSLTMAVLNGRFEIRSVEPRDFLLALQLQRRWGLLTNDSLQLAVAERMGLTEIATADKSFDAVQGLIVYKPGDVTGGT